RIEDDHTYGSHNVFSLNDIESETNISNKNVNKNIASNEGDASLNDLVRGYPHLYDKTSPNFKDSSMKILLLDVANECQNRWIRERRLRERFSKERREIEAEHTFKDISSSN
ncbi:hypothetical protein ALC57_00599, partial [Trachymyrmex cornetzi]